LYNEKINNILVVASHPDDEVLGCGGTIVRHVDGGDKVFILFLADGVTSRANKNDEEARLMRIKAANSASTYLGAELPRFLKFPDNKMDTIPFLDVVQEVEKVISEIRPKIVYTHHIGDLNIDHQITHKAVMTAARPQPNSTIREIYSFEVLSSTGWSTPSAESFFIPNKFVDISTTLDRKLSALEFYDGEMRKFPHSRSVKSVSILAHHRGSSMGMSAAEAFKVERILD
jgi:N-acetylglucosamine malate deacetylase 1